MVFGPARFVFGEIIMLALPSLERPLCISETFFFWRNSDGLSFFSFFFNSSEVLSSTGRDE